MTPPSLPLHYKQCLEFILAGNQQSCRGVHREQSTTQHEQNKEQIVILEEKEPKTHYLVYGNGAGEHFYIP